MIRTVARASAATLLLAASMPALAQATAQPEPEVGENEADEEQGEIIVTAQKIEQRAVDVPITISANTGERLRELGVSDLDELSFYVPGLNIQEQSANNPGIVIRGITSDSGSAQQAARVTVYYNGVDISRSRGVYQDIYDVDRIEVIKGPQATLFGTASAVGAISIISARPEEGFSGALTGGYGNYDQVLASGFLNAGSDTIAGRVAFAYKRRDGYVNNLAPNQDDLNGQNQLGVRASLRFTPSDALTVDLIGTYDRQRNPGTAFVSGSLPTTAGPADPFGDAFLGGSPFSQAVLGLSELGLERDVYDGNLSIAYEFADDWTLTLVNGYREFDSLEVFDADGSAAFYLEFAERAEGYQLSQETRIAYNGDRFRGSAGFNYFKEDSIQNVPFSSEEGTFLQCAARVIPGLACIAPNGTVTAANATALLTGGAATAIPYSSVFENQGENDAYSGFIDGTFIPFPELELTAGVRALFETRRSGFFARVPRTVIGNRASLIPGQVDTGGQTFEAEDDFDAILPRFNILYRFSDEVNGFVTASKGRRSPTIQLGARATATGPQPNFVPVAAETVWNYEVGLKGSTGAFSGTLGVFYQKYDNFQVSVVRSDGTIVTESAGSASNFGVEAEAQVRPTDAISLFGNFGYIDGGIDDKSSIAPTFRGARFRLQPELQASGGLTIETDLTEDIGVFFSPSVTYRSRIFFEVPNNPLISQDGVTLVNARAGLTFSDDRFEISAYVRNLFDEDYLLDAGNTGGAFGIPTFIPAEPRLYGVQASARF